MSRYGLFGATDANNKYVKFMSDGLNTFIESSGATNFGFTVDEITRTATGFTPLPGYVEQPGNEKPVTIRYIPMHLYKLGGTFASMKPIYVLSVNGDEDSRRAARYHWTVMMDKEELINPPKGTYLDRIFGIPLMTSRQIKGIREGTTKTDWALSPQNIPTALTKKSEDRRAVYAAVDALYREKYVFIKLESGQTFRRRAFEILGEIYSMLQPEFAIEVGFASYQATDGIDSLIGDAGVRIFVFPHEIDETKLQRDDAVLIDLDHTENIAKTENEELLRCLEKWVSLDWEDRCDAMRKLFVKPGIDFKSAETFVRISSEFFDNDFMRWLKLGKNVPQAGKITSLAELKDLYDSFAVLKTYGTNWNKTQFRKMLKYLLPEGDLKIFNCWVRDAQAEVVLAVDEGERKHKSALAEFGKQFVPDDVLRRFSEPVGKAVKKPIEEDCKNKLKAKDDDCAKKLKEKDDDCAKQLKDKDDDCTNRLKAKDDDCAKQLKDKDDDCTNRLKAKDDDCAKQLKDKDDDCTNRLKAKDDDCAKQLKDKDDDCTNRLKAKDDDCAKQLKDKDDDCTNRLKAKDDDCAKKLKEKEDDCKEKLAAQNAELEETKRRNKKEQDAAKASYEQKLQAEKKKFDEQRKAQAAEIEKLKKGSSQKDADKAKILFGVIGLAVGAAICFAVFALLGKLGTSEPETAYVTPASVVETTATPEATPLPTEAPTPTPTPTATPTPAVFLTENGQVNEEYVAENAPEVRVITDSTQIEQLYAVPNGYESVALLTTENIESETDEAAEAAPETWTAEETVKAPAGTETAVEASEESEEKLTDYAVLLRRTESTETEETAETPADACIAAEIGEYRIVIFGSTEFQETILKLCNSLLAENETPQIIVVLADGNSIDLTELLKGYFAQEETDGTWYQKLRYVAVAAEDISAFASNADTEPTAAVAVLDDGEVRIVGTAGVYYAVSETEESIPAETEEPAGDETDNA